VPLDPQVRASRAAARLARHLEVALAEVDLSMSQYRILGLLTRGTAAASVLADKLSVSRPSVTALVDGLIARRLVERQGDPDDRRKVHHQLTREGRRVLRKADLAITERLKRLGDFAPGGRDPAFEALLVWEAALDACVDARVLGRSADASGQASG
jgi:long-chain acyl-CoA synthetase